jgi:EpsI family protein
MAKKSFWVSLILLIATLVVVKGMHLGTNVAVWKRNLDKLPSTIGRMNSVDIPLEESVVKELDPDVYVFRNYTSGDGAVINVYIGYYGTRKGGRSEHNPDACYPGSGWAIMSEGKATILLGNNGMKETITLNTLQVTKDNEKQLVYHWYQTDKSKVIATGIQQNMNRLKNRLLYNRDDGAFIRVSTDIDNNYPEAKKKIEDFIKQLFPLLIKYWPLEREVDQ